MITNYNGIAVDWTDKEAAKIAEIKARRDWIPAARVEVADDKERQQYADGVERKIVRSKAMYWLWRCGVEMVTIADVFGTSARKVREAVELVKGGDVDNSRFR